MKKIAILTTFYEADSGYSLIAVVETQIRMLIDNGYNPIVIVQENFKTDKLLWQPEQIDIRPILPNLGASSGEIKDALYGALKDVDVCITHDIELLGTYSEHKKAIRSMDLNVLWLHWIHSRPTPGANSPPKGHIVYPNSCDVNVVIESYKLQGSENRVHSCRAAHAIDPVGIWNYDNLTKEIVRETNLLDSDISMVYPIRLDRGKQPEKIIRLLAGVKRAGYESKLVIVDWQSSGEKFQKYIDELNQLAESLFVDNDVFFTSRIDDRCNQGVPRHVVTELMDLSNVYVHPSKVETYSLVVHEAILRGNLVCLNHDFPPMRELYGDSAIYFDFGSDQVVRQYTPNEQAFWDDEAKRLVSEFYSNRVLVAQSIARRKWNPNSVWKDFERLLYLE